MLDAKWARYFRAILLTLAMPACGGSALVIDGTDAGGVSPARCAIVEHDAFLTHALVAPGGTCL